MLTLRYAGITVALTANPTPRTGNVWPYNGHCQNVRLQTSLILGYYASQTESVKGLAVSGFPAMPPHRQLPARARSEMAVGRDGP